MLVLFRLLARLPLGLAQSAGVALGLLAYLLSPSYRRKVGANLARAGLPGSLAWACARQAGCMVGELPFVWFRSPDATAAKLRHDFGVLDAARAEGRGVLVLTPHLGGFEMAARSFAGHAPITVLFKPPKRASLARLMAAARNQARMRALPTDMSGVRGLLRALRAGEVVGLLPDQVPDSGQGEWATFFGEPAYTLTLPHRLAQQTRCAVVLAACERLGIGQGWRLHLERMHEPPTPQALNEAMQRMILRWPTQYLWGYNRYKRPQGLA